MTAFINPPYRFQGCLVYRDSHQNIPNSTATYIAYTNTVFDTDNFHDTVTNPERFTIPAGVSRARLSMGAYWGSTNLTGSRLVEFQKNSLGNYQGRTLERRYSGGPFDPVYHNLIMPWVTVEEGDYLSIMVFQDSGVTLPLIAIASGGMLWACLEVSP